MAHAVGRALEELHEAGVRHGDVKPANVLRGDHDPTRDAADDRGATLIDLGLATDVGAAPLGGTPRYAAPELRTNGEAGPVADVWALGVLLAEILDSRVAEAADPRSAIGAWAGRAAGEPAPMGRGDDRRGTRRAADGGVGCGASSPLVGPPRGRA